MGHISSSFSNASPGTLKCTLSGDFTQGTGRDAGFPGGASDMLLRASINGVKSPAISRQVPSVEFTIADYPGGGTSWAVTTEMLDHSSSGTSSYGFSNLAIDVVLIKK